MYTVPKSGTDVDLRKKICKATYRLDELTDTVKIASVASDTIRGIKKINTKNAIKEFEKTNIPKVRNNKASLLEILDEIIEAI